MRPDYCTVANEPCQAMCLDGCRLRERSYYVAELEKERRQLQTMLNQERSESEALLRQALDTLAYWLEHGETPGAHDMIQRTHDALQERLIPLGAGKGVGKREHITDGSPCWCNPETTYTDPDTGVSVIVHKEPQ